MKKLFGAKKKEEPKPPAPTLTDTSTKVGNRNSINFMISLVTEARLSKQR